MDVCCKLQNLKHFHLPFTEDKLWTVRLFIVIVVGDASGIEAVLVVTILKQRNVGIVDAPRKFCEIVPSNEFYCTVLLLMLVEDKQ